MREPSETSGAAPSWSIKKMSFSSQVRRFFSASARRDAKREARRRQALSELRSRRLFEILESRQL
ncbi:MAG: hypothetical protein J6K20_14345, partial [Thermoguttaceae bacterium]|nr:hypothetical protein [Thermoguttaceae bacterium]